MAEIPRDFGQGGAYVTPEGSGTPGLKTILDDIADDLGDRASIAAPALLAFTDPPSAAEMALLRTLVNEIRAAMNNTVRTTKQA